MRSILSSSRFWDTHLELDETVSKMESLTLFETPKQHMEVSADLTIGTESQVSKTDTVETSLEEEQQTFVIRAVVDPRTNTQISIQDAIMMGVMDQPNGLYVNPDTRESISIAQAMNNGKIIVEIVSIKKTKAEKKSYGLITINTTKETRPYHIESVIDPNTDLQISVTEATQRGILNVQKGLYKSDNGEYIQLIDAIESGCVKVEYRETAERVPPETISRTYSVHSVVDVLNSQTMSFADAIDKGLLDKDSGNFLNNKTGETVFVSEAIKRGFIKARIVTDENSLDVDPNNRIIIQKFEHAKDKLFRGVKAVKAFQAAGRIGKK